MGDNKEFFKLVDLVKRRLREEEDENDPELRVSLRETQSQEERCAVCRDGPDGLVVCRGCGTLLHATCLIDVRGCPTLGCNEKDPLQAAAKPVSNTCIEHGEMSDKCRADLRDLWGSDLRCTCEKKPVCKHKFNPMDNRCDYCHEALETVAAKEIGSTFLPRKDMASYPITSGDMRRLGIPPEADETVVCGNQGCEEPTAKCLVFCALCHADDDCGVSPCTHNDEIIAHQKRANERRQRKKRGWDPRFYVFWLGFLLFWLAYTFLYR